jgi:hypothetical protein
MEEWAALYSKELPKYTNVRSTIKPGLIPIKARLRGVSEASYSTYR